MQKYFENCKYKIEILTYSSKMDCIPFETPSRVKTSLQMHTLYIGCLMKRRDERMTAKKLARVAYDNALRSINL